MSYGAACDLQGAVWQALRDDAALGALVGDAIFDAMPVDPPSGPYLALGAEDVSDAGDMTARGARHDFVVSVVEGGEAGGFAMVKAAAAAAVAALDGAAPALPGARMVGVWFQRARARRAEQGGARRVDLTFRARVDFG